jgi:hypothetical protein
MKEAIASFLGSTSPYANILIAWLNFMLMKIELTIIDKNNIKVFINHSFCALTHIGASILSGMG